MNFVGLLAPRKLDLASLSFSNIARFYVQIRAVRRNLQLLFSVMQCILRVTLYIFFLHFLAHVCVHVRIDGFYMPVSFEGNCGKGPEDTVAEDRFLQRGLLKRRRRSEAQPVVI